MTLLRWELKKIWRPGILVMLLILGAMYYYVRPSFYIRHFANGPNAQAELDFSMEWAEKYGPTMEPQERAELDEQLRQETAAFDRMVSALPQAAAVGIDSYETFCRRWDALRRDDGSDSMEAERQLLRRITEESNFNRLQMLEHFLERYDFVERQPALRTQQVREQHENGGYYSARMVNRVEEIDGSDRRWGYLPDGVTISTDAYLSCLAVWVVLSVILLLSPTLVRDRLHHVRCTQWASRRGRSILRVQMLSAAVSAALLTLLNLTLYALPFLGKHPLVFREFRRTGLGEWGVPWFDGNYGQYLLLAAAVLLALGVGCGLVTVFLSQFSEQYVAMLLKAIPLFVVLGPLLGAWMLDGVGTFRWLYPGSGIPLPPWAELHMLALLLLVGSGLCVWACRRQRRMEEST